MACSAHEKGINFPYDVKTWGSAVKMACLVWGPFSGRGQDGIFGPSKGDRGSTSLGGPTSPGRGDVVAFWKNIAGITNINKRADVVCAIVHCVALCGCFAANKQCSALVERVLKRESNLLIKYYPCKFTFMGER